MQISDYFWGPIIHKWRAEEEQIPSVRETAAMMEINPNTAMRVFHYFQKTPEKSINQVSF